MSLDTLITNFTTSDDKQSKRTASSLKSDQNLKNLSKYVRGGITKMNKEDIEKFNEGLHAYKKGTYMVGGKEIIPDPEQDLIINAPVDKNIRVIAGAGTGKTTTITCRIKYLLDTCITPDKILVLTFNVEARKNLETMIDRLMGFEIKMDVRTIDSFCFKIKNDFFSEYEYNQVMNDNKQYINRSVSEYGIVGRKIMEKYGREISSQYKYIFFDEFQDVDEDQFEILKIFSNNGCYLTVIGDDSQNIYQFRGSDNYYIINFDRIITNTLTYKITTNYRSTEEIVALANTSIKHNKDKIFKLMQHHTDDKGSIELTLYETDDESNDFIIIKILEYIENNTEYGDIAILSRNTHPLKILETEFERNKLPYVSLISDQYSTEFKQIIQQNKIVLSTIHKAKGLEWKVVFIIGLCDAYFPNHLNNGLKNIEEERRLFYVATTRAKRNIHFVGSKKEIPMSRFIGEVAHHIDIVNNLWDKNKLDHDAMFLGDDENKIKDSYSVMKVIEMLSGRKIEKLREIGLIPNTSLRNEQIFNEPLYYTDEIKKNVFESDYGIFCDYYMTRQLMIHNKQDIKDIHVEKILINLHLNDEEIILYRKHNIKDCLVNKKMPNPSNITSYENKKVKELIEKLNGIIKMRNLSAFNIEQLLSMGLQNYHYPEKFIKKLRSSYDIYKDPKKIKIDQDMIRSIYHVSLCLKFNADRRRLVYRDIQYLYDENSKEVIPRIDAYVKKIVHNEIICKLQMHKTFKIDKNIISFVGELDYIDITNNTLVDIKCSEGDFRIEWLIQLLMYYSLFMCNSNCCENYDNIEINKLAIMNIFTGKYYEIDLPQNYNWERMLEFVRDMISNDIKGIRKSHDIDNVDNVDDIDIIDDNAENNVKIVEEIVELDCMHTNPKIDMNTMDTNDDKYEIISVDINDDDRKGYIVLDVENNTTNMDIIQFSYIVYDSNHNILKEINSYIKDRFVDCRANQITGITTDILRQKGIEFFDVIKEFVEDIAKVTTLCGHNICTDIAKIKSNMMRYKIKVLDSSRANNEEYIDLFSTIVVDDTVTLYKLAKGCKRSIKLQNMYEELFNDKMIDAHDALSDVKHTAKCYVELQRLIDLNIKNDNKIDKTVIKVNNKVDNKNNITKKIVTVKKTPQTPKKILSSSLVVGNKEQTNMNNPISVSASKNVLLTINKTDINNKTTSIDKKNINNINNKTNSNKSNNNNKTTSNNKINSNDKLNNNNKTTKETKVVKTRKLVNMTNNNNNKLKTLDEGLSSIMNSSFFS